MINSSKLKGRIVEKGYSQKTIADLMGISQASMNLKLSGKRPLSLDEAYSLGRILDIGLDKYRDYFFYNPDCVEQ